MPSLQKGVLGACLPRESDHPEREQGLANGGIATRTLGTATVGATAADFPGPPLVALLGQIIIVMTPVGHAVGDDQHEPAQARGDCGRKSHGAGGGACTLDLTTPHSQPAQTTLVLHSHGHECSSVSARNWVGWGVQDRDIGREVRPVVTWRICQFATPVCARVHVVRCSQSGPKYKACTYTGI